MSPRSDVSRPPLLNPILVLAILGAAMVTAEILSGSMMPQMARGLGTSEGMIGQAVTVTALVAIVTSLSIGSIAGNRDRRQILIMYTGVLAASNLRVALAPNVWLMLTARLLLGLSIGMVWGMLPAVVLRLSAPGEFARTFVRVVLGVSAAGVVVAPLAAWLGDLIGWRVVYVGATALALIALTLLVISFPTLPAKPGVFDRDLRGTLRLPGLIAGMSGLTLIFAGSQAFLGYQVPFLNQITGFGTREVSLSLLLTGISGVIGTVMASRLLGISIYGVLVIAPAAMAIMLGVLWVVGDRGVLTVPTLMVWIGLRALIGVAVNAWVAHSFPAQVEGAGGILVAVIQGSMMLGAILGGVLIDTTSANALPIAGGIILAIATVVCLRVLKPRPTAPILLEELATPLTPSPAMPGALTDEAV